MNRLNEIASMINQDDIVLDVGTDHAYLPIILIKENKCKKVYASDISLGALDMAKKNLAKNNIKLDLILSDGLKNINIEYNTLVISGMGTNTIINILESGNIPNKIILSSHNKLYELRKYLNKLGYFIKKEKVILENNKYYDIICYLKGNEKLPYKYMLYGKSFNKEYYKYNYLKEKELFSKVNISKKINILKKLFILKKLINEKKQDY